MMEEDDQVHYQYEQEQEVSRNMDLNKSYL